MSGVNISPDYVELMGLETNEALLGGVVAVYYCGTLIGVSYHLKKIKARPQSSYMLILKFLLSRH